MNLINMHAGILDLFLRVPASREFRNIKKITIREICVSGNVAIYSTNTNYPTYKY